MYAEPFAIFGKILAAGISDFSFLKILSKVAVSESFVLSFVCFAGSVCKALQRAIHGRIPTDVDKVYFGEPFASRFIA